MLGRWFDKKHSAIGIDIGSHTIRLLQLCRRGGRAGVAAAAQTPTPVDLPAEGPVRVAALAEILKRLLEENGFAGRNAVSCLPATAMHYKNLRLPRMPAEELHAAVEWEATDRLKVANGQARVQFYDAGEVRQGEESRQEIILMAVPTAVIEEHVQTLTQAGLQPTAIDAAPSALQRALVHDDPANAELPARFILDAGYAASKVLIVRRGGVVFFKSIDIGGRRLDETVAAKLNLSVADANDLRRRLHAVNAGAPDADQPLIGSTRRENVERAVFEALRPVVGELAREVGLCLRYYSVTFRGRRPESVLLAGGEAYDPHLAKMLAEDIGLSVERARPLQEVDLDRAPAALSTAGDLSEWSIAAGLALRDQAVAAKRGAA